MPHQLKNKNVTILIDLPLEGYNQARFDWTNKIVSVKYQDSFVTGIERIDITNHHTIGKGFYSEFGIDTPIGFEETNIGDWFHKIGVGLLKKEDHQYLFNKDYEIKPCKFEISIEPNKIIINCISESSNGYSYLLKKEIELQESGFIIKYNLKNTGAKAIVTTEYNHNFMAIDHDFIGENYILKFPFQLKPHLFEETVNPKLKINIGASKFTFESPSKDPFFFSNLSGNEMIVAAWELNNTKSNLGIRETASFKTNKVNLWGWEHVISPELFHHINLKAGQSSEWTRTYEIFKIL